MGTAGLVVGLEEKGEKESIPDKEEGKYKEGSREKRQIAQSAEASGIRGG